MHKQMIGFLGVAVFSLTGCAGHRTAQVYDLKTRVAQLDGRVSMLEQHLGVVEGKAWNQREDVSYLRGRVEGMQTGLVTPAKAVSTKPTPKRIQTALKNAGYYTSSIDGKIGPQTKQAIKEFQRTHGLAVDGKVGAKTWAQLSAFLPGE